MAKYRVQHRRDGLLDLSAVLSTRNRHLSTHIAKGVKPSDASEAVKLLGQKVMADRVRYGLVEDSGGLREVTG